MTDVRDVARGWNRHQASVAQLAIARTASAWSALNPADLSGSWGTTAGPAMVRTLTAAQRLATAGAGEYVAAAVTAQGGDPVAEASVSSSAFAGTAADGRALAGLLYLPVLSTKAAIADGLPVEQAIAVGARELAMLVGTEVADAGRDAVGASMTATRSVHGYVRMVAGSACSRCIVLAGKHYRWNASFARHPHCHCTGIPALENRAGDLTTDPHVFFDRLSPMQQDARFGKAGARAIREGADVFQVVNAHRGLTTRELYGRTVQTTTEGMTRRGIAGRRIAAASKPGAARVRLSVSQIYAEAGADRELAVSLLRKYAYLF